MPATTQAIEVEEQTKPADQPAYVDKVVPLATSPPKTTVNTELRTSNEQPLRERKPSLSVRTIANVVQEEGETRER